MLWVKSLHLIFVVSWFSGLFYLPRLYVNLAMENDPQARARLLTMARKLFRFTTILAIPAVLLGLWLFVGYGIGLHGPGQRLDARQAGAGAVRDRLSPCLRHDAAEVRARSEHALAPLLPGLQRIVGRAARGDRDPRDRQAVLTDR